MSGLPAPAERALDDALFSMHAFHALDWLVRRHPRPGTLSEAVFATGLHVCDLARALSTLAARGVIVAETGGLHLSSGYAPGLVYAWRRMAVDATVRRRIVGLAADREAAADHVVMRVSWAPQVAGPPAEITSPPVSPTLSASVPGAPDPIRSADPAAPAS